LLEEEKGRCENIGVRLAPYLFTWNLQRFKEYVKRSEKFDVKKYFKDLGDILNKLKNNEKFKNLFKSLKDLRLDKHEIPKEDVENLFISLHRKLRKIGIGQSEPVMTIKILHTLSPNFFPLLDNNILNALKKKGKCNVSMSGKGYVRWMEYLQTWLKNYPNAISTLKKELNRSILKLVDELLYITCSVKLKNYVDKLEIC